MWMKTNNQIHTYNVCNKMHTFSKLSTYTHQIFRSTSMQEASTWWGWGVPWQHVYQCEREEMYTLYSERKNKICYTFSTTYKVQDLYIFTMLCTLECIYWLK